MSQLSIGTNHFVSLAAAVEYYRATEGDDAKQVVKQKLKEKLIAIGAPVAKEGYKIKLSLEEGRYYYVTRSTI